MWKNSKSQADNMKHPKKPKHGRVKTWPHCSCITLRYYACHCKCSETKVLRYEVLQSFTYSRLNNHLTPRARPHFARLTASVWKIFAFCMVCLIGCLIWRAQGLLVSFLWHGFFRGCGHGWHCQYHLNCMNYWITEIWLLICFQKTTI